MPVVIPDTSCWIALDSLDRLAILKDLFSTLLVTPEVLREYGHDLTELSWVSLVSTPFSLQRRRWRGLGSGEQSVIEAGEQLPGSLLIIDDLRARHFATRLGLEVTGTVDTLVLAKEQGLLGELKPLLRELRNRGFQFFQQVEDNALARVNE